MAAKQKAKVSDTVPLPNLPPVKKVISENKDLVPFIFSFET